MFCCPFSLPSLFSLHLNFICVIAEAYGAEARIKLTSASAGATSLSSDVARGKCSIRARKNRGTRVTKTDSRQRRFVRPRRADFPPKWSDFSNGSGNKT